MPFNTLARRAAVTAAFCALLALPAGAAVTVTQTAALSFGKLVPGTSGGTVTLSPAGVRSASGVTLFTQGATQQAAAFTVVGGTGGAICTLSVPTFAPAPLSLNGAAMGISNFYVSDAGNSLRLSPPESSASITLDGLGGYSVKVGAMLTVGPNQAAGNYASTFSVSVSCP